MVVAATGFFDGLHLGHRKVIEELTSIAVAQGGESMIISFWPHPRTVLQQDAYKLRLLTTLEEKRELCFSLGIDRFEVICFDKEFSQLSTEEFFKRYLIGKYNVSTLVVGYDHRLGHGKDDRDIEEIAASCGIRTVCVGELQVGERVISSTAIRNRLVEGDIARANEWLGYRYTLHGVVVAGNRLGRTIGFPTANMQLYEPLKLVPANGVYFVRVEVTGGTYKGICNIGTRPTVSNDSSRRIETHILDFDEEIYGLDIRISFIERLRDERRFGSLEELRRQLLLDKKCCMKKIM
ncbi:MAG TPA: bifunctional riboflavin kinase/FAD synthetase [Bacteroidales bacterium]|jgi:riboflavin kinase/FMN adenylyltransferase|nr:bifunctional riboflavin kinase/FAD synthetase [Bacteroidales bacterium]HPY21651.1 bifunctional riboflavin kinase/FAD synthetase [Bacteroidales bacterium]HQA93222.1 bifunctional riboflavin kinase/FAD synthetase [Bacteroidales bacterium]HQN23497.1 bifunctional riboflavin kinase/FAD synthetase [Bacteroidales bacterium]HQP78424.1 bifunctional riboflavin kinase/FAD synthetase [Bacteroidales bacterium]